MGLEMLGMETGRLLLQISRAFAASQWDEGRVGLESLHGPREGLFLAVKEKENQELLLWSS